MGNADEMFYKLGYSKVIDDDNIYYNYYLSNSFTITIQFVISEKILIISMTDPYDKTISINSLSIQELQAVIEKLKELDPLHMTPMEAINALFELKELE